MSGNGESRIGSGGPFSDEPPTLFSSYGKTIFTLDGTHSIFPRCPPILRPISSKGALAFDVTIRQTNSTDWYSGSSANGKWACTVVRSRVQLFRSSSAPAPHAAAGI